jgi:hypothetical protein
MSKRKRSRKVATVATAWSDVEEAFFAAAPPDDPAPGPEPLRFDDLVAEPSKSEVGTPVPAWWSRLTAELRRLVATGRAGSERLAVWVVLATLLVLVGLSAAVFH